MNEKSFTNKAVSNAALLHITSETPFDKRHDCWFCGEPNQYIFTYHNPFESQISVANASITKKNNINFSQLSLPSCKECYQVANNTINKAKYEGHNYSIWTIKLAVKQYLIQHYRKDLAIGLNWTKAELENSEFEQGNFAGFQRSAWFMFEVAKARVNYVSWPLFIDGLMIIDEYQEYSFNFDGVVYPNIEQAMHYYAKTMSLKLDYFRSVLELLGESNFAEAVRFCRLLIAENAFEQQQALRQLRKEVNAATAVIESK